MTESAETSSRFPFDDFSNSEKKKSPSVKEVKSEGKSKMFPFNVFRSSSDRSDYRKEPPAVSPPAKPHPSGMRRYSYTDLHSATNGFNPTRIIKAGSHGVVYRGTLSGQQEVAVKLRTATDGRAIAACRSEIKLMSELRHRNVVRLLGWCEDRLQVALVFELLPNGSLADHLRGGRASSPLPWKAMYWKVAVGLASALVYLHEGLDCCVVHGGVKPSNVWLDAEGNPKLAGFELSIIAQHDASASTVSTVTDVYGFGVVLLQMARSRSRSASSVDVELREKARAVDRDLADEMKEREAERLFKVGVCCTQSNPESRPPMKVALQMLNFEVPMPTTNFPDNGPGTTTVHEAALSSPVLFPPEVIKNIDGVVTSTENGIDRDDRMMLESIQDSYQEDEYIINTMFDIGIPPDFSKDAGIERSRKDSHRSIVMGFVESMHEMMRSEESLPRFEEALKKIKACTVALVAMVGPPLDDWNALAQLVLRSLKEREDFCEICTDDGATTVDEEGLSRGRSVSEDERELEDCRERLALARERCKSLEAELAMAQQMSSAVEEEMKVVERRITPERRRRHGISRRYQRVLSELSDFAC